MKKHFLNSTIISPMFLFMLVFIAGGSVCGFAAGIESTVRGAKIDGKNYRAEIRDGVLVSFVNKFTKEEYISKSVNIDELKLHLPTGLGTQNSDIERESSKKLMEWPWWEQPNKNTWPNQHFPDTTSKFEYKKNNDNSAILTYTGLSNGKDKYNDETYAIELSIDAETGDLLITPSADSPRGGVYGCGFTVSALANDITVEAPIFEGVRLDRKMQPMLWINQWGSFWDYSFVALNGEKTGAVGLWCQDKDLKVYKNLFYMIDEQGLSLSVQALNLPPFNELKTSKPMTWRLQAFSKSWSQAAARFREWRQKNVKIAPRPEWVKNISYMSYGMQHTDPINSFNFLNKFFEPKDLERVLTWAADVRVAGFDKNHTNNTPYPGFREDVKKYNEKNNKLMVYLQPMIMWGPDPKTEREQKALEYSKEANTRSPFRADLNTVEPYHDQHNLGHPQWQRWFLDWVKEYIQDYGINGIYHDQSYMCPIDVRGASAPGGMTSTQGMADYFYKAATENPGSIHGTEHLTEVNSVGASLGLGCGILWGTPGYETKNQIGPEGSMNWQRIKKASPVSNALHYPNGAIYAFPHVSHFWAGPVRFHHGMDQMERRGDIPGNSMWEYMSAMKVPFDNWVNDIWIDRERIMLFVRNGLRADFPEDWDRKVLSYFKGAKGEDFRYEETAYGSAFTEYQKNKRILHYARIQNVEKATVEGAIIGWPCYDKNGPIGLNPKIIYCVNGAISRPAATFSFPDNAKVYLKDGYSNESIAWMQMENMTGSEKKKITVMLSAPIEPVAVWVDGTAVKPLKSGKQWKIPAETTSFVAVLFKSPASGIKDLPANGILNRVVNADTKRDFFNPAAFAKDITQKDKAISMCPARAGIGIPTAYEIQNFIPIKIPDNDGVLKISAPTGKTIVGTWRFNGKVVIPVENSIEIAMKSGELSLLSFTASGAANCNIEWKVNAGTALVK
ncbi:MAG: DUF6259 domain-containing protein [bacterium]